MTLSYPCYCRLLQEGSHEKIFKFHCRGLVNMKGRKEAMKTWILNKDMHF